MQTQPREINPKVPYHCSMDMLVPISLADKEKREQEKETRMQLISLDSILADVSLAMGYSSEKIASKSRKREYVLCRMIYFHVCKKMTSATLKGMGKRLGDRDHTTAIHNLQSVKDFFDTKDPVFMNYWNHYIANSTLFTENDFK